MKVDEIRALSIDEIQARIDESREELMNLRFQQATGELVDFNQIRRTRQLIARLMTILNQQLDEQMEGEA